MKAQAGPPNHGFEAEKQPESRLTPEAAHSEPIV
jgi:hypothetical protein